MIFLMESKEKTRINDILIIKEDIDNKLSSLSNGEINAFDNVSLHLPDFTVAIHGFYTAITWLYVQYFEAGKITIDFLVERATAFGLNPEGYLSKHINTVHCFRTYLQHNVDLSKNRNIAKIKSCTSWMFNAVGRHERIDESYWPNSNKEWVAILDKLISDATKFFYILKNTLEEIEKDEFVDDTIKMLIEHFKRNYPAHRFDSIISIVAADMGLAHIDSLALRKRHIEKWNKHLQLLQTGFDFDCECRRLIETTLLNDEEIPMPITGKDIMDEFQIPPGREIRKLMSIARKLYCDDYCSKAELLSRLKDASIN